MEPLQDSKVELLQDNKVQPVEDNSKRAVVYSEVYSEDCSDDLSQIVKCFSTRIGDEARP